MSRNQQFVSLGVVIEHTREFAECLVNRAEGIRVGVCEIYADRFYHFMYLLSFGLIYYTIKFLVCQEVYEKICNFFHQIAPPEVLFGIDAFCFLSTWQTLYLPS